MLRNKQAVVSFGMERKRKLKTLLKKLFSRVFGLMGVEILTSSDHSINGLQPFVQEFFIRQSHGILHIGAHEGQEAEAYDRLSKPVIWIEAIPLYFEKLRVNIKSFGNQVALNALLDSKCHNSRDFFITSNNAESSSIYPLAENDYWKGLKNSDILQLPARRLDCVFSSSSLKEFDYWIIDVQGAEIEVLKGAGNLLSFCKYLQVEISQEEFYNGGAQFADLKDFLESKSFFPIWLPTHPHEEVIFKNTNFKSAL
jgi:FkbM family methyltransferase